MLAFSFAAFAKLDLVTQESQLGEKSLDSYSDRYYPLVTQDPYRGKMHFKDDLFFNDYFSSYLFEEERDYSHFLSKELDAGLACPNDTLSKHFDDIRYSYRLITLSYLLEGQWHLQLAAKQFRFKKACGFDIGEWSQKCAPKSVEMKKFISVLRSFKPSYDEQLPVNYTKSDWMKEFSSRNYKWYSQYRVSEVCGENCSEGKLEESFQQACDQNKKVLDLICHEEDELYGLSRFPDAYFLINRSNIINTFNQNDEARSCLRRFSEVMGHKEASYPALRKLFPPLQAFLTQKYQERFMQGRVFFFGAGKEFEQKGLSNFYVKEQPLVVKALEPDAPAQAPLPPKEEKKVAVAPVVVTRPAPVPVVKVAPKKLPPKSAFLLAAELRASSESDQVQVDMQKLRYDYVFTLSMINNLSQKLKNFMTRDALKEMMDFDKLGTKEGPVPLLFLKYMIDMQEHHGLWNIVAVLGDKFYVSNEIDPAYKPGLEYVEISNNESTNGQWQLTILKDH